MTDIEGFLTIYGHTDNLLNNNMLYKVILGIVSVDEILKCDHSKENCGSIELSDW